MATEPRPMDPERLADARAFSRAWRGERDESGDLIEGPEWDTDDIVWALRDLLADRDYQAQRADAAEANYRFMVERAAGGGRLDGYRELGQRAADAERERDEARAEVARLRERLEAREMAADEAVAAERERAETAEAEVIRLRSRVRVEADDATGVTSSRVEAWLARHGWVRIDDGVGDTASVWRHEWPKGSPSIVAVDTVAKASEFAEIINRLAKLHRKCGLDILDEMARTEAPK